MTLPTIHSGAILGGMFYPKRKAEMSKLEMFLQQHLLDIVFCSWFRDACQSSDEHRRVWGFSAIHALSLLEIDAHDDLVFIIRNIEEQEK